MSCAEKSWRLTRELRRQFWGSIFNAFLASTQWPSSVAGCRAVESLGRTYAQKLKIAHLQALVPGFQNYRETGFVFRRLRSTEDSHLLQREGVTQQYIAKKAQMR